ncbi:MAG TPA: CPBP family intramembrane glutamic endopeptidase [Candidatus Binatia bacterium]|jgi:membrane protease YdiL (CAAX protease family)|nr:CPBP family intramembrane glutamic endopeptidase [Candidatus Binatia bacterium]
MVVEQPGGRTLVEAGVLLAAMVAWFGPWGRALVEMPSATAMIVATGMLLLAIVAALAAAGGTLDRLGLRGWPHADDVRYGLWLVLPTYATAGLAALAATGLTIVLGSESIEGIVAAKEPVVNMIADLDPWTMLPIALFVGLYEEVAFRGFLLPRLAGVLPGWLAVLLAAFAFGLAHLPSQGWIGVAQTTVAGTVLGAATLRRQSLWPAIVCHASFDLLSFALILLARPYLDRVL